MNKTYLTIIIGTIMTFGGIAGLSMGFGDISQSKRIISGVIGIVSLLIGYGVVLVGIMSLPRGGR